MTRHFIVYLALGVFFLVSVGVFQLLAVRFLLDIRSATLEIGFGPPVFLLHLNRFTYQINFFPLFFFNIGLSRDLSLSQRIFVHFASVAGFLSISALAICAVLGAILLFPTEEASLAATGKPISGTKQQLLIKAVAPSSIAERTGLKPGNRIHSVNGETYHSGIDMVAAFLQSREPVVLDVQQDKGAHEKISVPHRGEDGKLLKLGLTVLTSTNDDVYSPEPPLVPPIRTVLRDGFREAARVWTSTLLLYNWVEPPPVSRFDWELLIVVAGLSVAWAGIVLLNFLGEEYKALLPLTIIVTVIRAIFGMPVPVIAVLILIAAYSLERMRKGYRENLGVSEILALLVLWIFYVSPLANGLAGGLGLGVLTGMHKELTWNL